MRIFGMKLSVSENTWKETRPIQIKAEFFQHFASSRFISQNMRQSCGSEWIRIYLQLRIRIRN
jgi:hypothetical protein